MGITFAIVIGILLIIAIAFILYSILTWWNNKKLIRIREEYENEYGTKIEPEREFIVDETPIPAGIIEPAEPAKPIAAIESDVQRPDRNESVSAGGNGIPEVNPFRAGEHQDSNKPIGSQEIDITELERKRKMHNEKIQRYRKKLK